MRGRPGAWAGAALLLLLAPLAPEPLAGRQETAPPTPSAGDPWNGADVLELVERGRLARNGALSDGTLATWQARVEGHVYFFLDPERGERALIRVDQVAVDVGWEAPDRFRQRVVGERSETRLPVRDFRYYADRISLVESGFGDEIRVGAGLDVAGVPHPLAPVADEAGIGPYDFRLRDALVLTLPGREAPLRVQEVEVRPRDPSAPGFLGWMALETESGALVRMGGTFTPSAYVDPRNDRIEIHLEYGLWEDRFWLPNLQRIEVRREIPDLDLGLGTVIRSILRTSDYRFGEPLPPELRSVAPLLAAPLEERRSYPFVDGLLDRVARDGLAEMTVDPDLRALRAELASDLRVRAPSGFSPLRLHLPRASSALRYSRAEGFHVGAGLTLTPGGGPTRIRLLSGYGFGSGRPSLRLGLESIRREGQAIRAEGFLNDHEDLGLAPAADPTSGTIAALFRGEDFQDPVRVSGGLLRVTRGSSPAIALEVGALTMRTPAPAFETAPLGGERRLRPLRPVEEGNFLRLGSELALAGGGPFGSRTRARVGVTYLAGGPGGGVALEGAVETRWGSPAGTRDLTLHLRGWSWQGDPLPQGHRLVGGRGTLPGTPFRKFLGQDAATASLRASTDLGGPLLRLHAGLHAAWAGRADPAVASAWDATPSDGIRSSATLGAGFPWDAIRVEAARPFHGEGWTLLVSIDPRWWDRL